MEKILFLCNFLIFVFCKVSHLFIYYIRYSIYYIYIIMQKFPKINNLDKEVHL